MAKKQYYLELSPRPQQETPAEVKCRQKREKILREFFFNHANTLRLTRYGWFNVLKLRKFGTESDPQFQTIMELLKPYFLRKEGHFRHYFFRLTNQLKGLLRKESIFLPVADPDSIFYALENPTYYQGDEILFCLISHDYLADLRLNKKEKTDLEKQLDLKLIEYP